MHDQGRREAIRWIASRHLAGAGSRFARATPGLSLARAGAARVHAVGFGEKHVQGCPGGVLALRVFVSRKLPLRALDRQQRLPAFLDGVPVDVVEAPPARVCSGGFARPPRRMRQRPLHAGVSLAHARVLSGTLGGFCRSRRADERDALFLLSNNHVLADVNAGAAGDPILQPARIDGGTMADRVAALHRFVPIELEETDPPRRRSASALRANRVDGAIARLDDGVGEEAGVAPVQPVRRAEVGLDVCKQGRQTGLTWGRVSDVDFTVLVEVDEMNPERAAIYEGQLRIEPRPSDDEAGADRERVRVPFDVWRQREEAFGLGGDSGAVVEDAAGAAVGLFFAGDEHGAYGIANPIDAVLDTLEVDLLTSSAPSRG